MMKTHLAKKNISLYLKAAVLLLCILSLFTGLLGCGNLGPVYVEFCATLDGKAWQGPLEYTVENQGGMITIGCYSEDHRTDTLKTVNQMDKVSRFGETTTYVSGGPEGAVFCGLFYFEQYLEKHEHTDSQQFIDGKSDSKSYSLSLGNKERTGCGPYFYNVSYGFIFRSPRTVNINTTLDGNPWSGPVNYYVQSVINETVELAHNKIEYKDPVHTYSLTKNLTGDISPKVYGDVTGDNVMLTYLSGGPDKAKLASITPNRLDLKAGENGTITMNFVSDQIQVIEPPVEKLKTGIQVEATLDGRLWDGSVSYSLSGPGTLSGSSTPQSFSDIEPGTYTVNYISGGPEDAKYTGAEPASQSIPGGTSGGFVLKFQSLNRLSVLATLDGNPWEGAVNYSLSGPASLSGAAAPQIFTGVTPGQYTLSYVSGGPSDAVLSSIIPASLEITDTNKVSVTMVFVSTGSITVNGSFNNAAWSGVCHVVIKGPATDFCTSLPHTFTGLPVGDYTISYISGGPDNSSYDSITPAVITLSAGGGTPVATVSFSTQRYVAQTAPVADLTLTATASNYTPSGSGYVNYYVTVTNNGPLGANGVQVTFLVTAPLTYTSNTPSQGTYNRFTGVWDVGNMAPGSTCTLVVYVGMGGLPSGTVITITGEVTASGITDPDSIPNNANPAEDDQSSVTITIA